MDQVTAAQTLLEKSDYRKASLMAKKAMDNLLKVGNHAEAIRALEIRVNAMYAIQDYEKAISVLREVLSEFKQKGERHGVVLVTSLIADANLSKGDAREALQKAEEAKEYAKDERDRLGEAVALRTLRKIKLHLDQLEEAIELSHRVADIMQECKDPEAQGFEMYSIAQLHLRAKQFDECIVAARKAASLFRSEEVCNSDAEAHALRVGAQAFWHTGVLRQASWQEGKTDCALSMCLAACQLYKVIGNAQDQFGTGIMATRLLLELSEFDEAYEMAVELRQLAKKKDFSMSLLIEAITLSIEALTSRQKARKDTATLKSQRAWLQAAVDAANELVGVSKGVSKIEQAEANRVLANSLLVKERLSKDGSFALAQQAAEKYLALAVGLQDQSLEANACLLLSEVHFANKDINAAIQAIDRADELYKASTDLVGRAKVESLRMTFRFSDQWHKVRVKAADGSLRNADEVEKATLPTIATEWQEVKATVYIHFDNLQARAAKNIG